MRRRRATAKGRKLNAKHQRDYKRRNRDDVNADRKAKYQEKIEAGECVCCKADALPDSNWCQKHRDSHSKAVSEWRQRRNGKKIPRRKPGKVVSITTRLVGKPYVAKAKKPSILDQIVQVMARFDEVTNRDLQEATGISSSRLSTILRRLRVSGRIERLRGQQGDIESAYRIARKEAA